MGQENWLYSNQARAMSRLTSMRKKEVKDNPLEKIFLVKRKRRQTRDRRANVGFFFFFLIKRVV